jgi:hypothetical protein
MGSDPGTEVRVGLVRWYRDRALRRQYGEPVILVSGLPRSGTSMMMKMLAAGGLELVTDHVRQADDDNPLGYFETEAVRRMEESEDRSWIADHRGEVVKVISHLLPKLPKDVAYKVILMRRNIAEVIASQNTMLERRGESRDDDPEELSRRYEIHLRKTALLVDIEPNLAALDIAYHDVVANPLAQARRVQRFLRMPLDVRAMAGVVDPNLYRNRS